VWSRRFTSRPAKPPPLRCKLRTIRSGTLGVEQWAIRRPWGAFASAVADLDPISLDTGEIYAKKHGTPEDGFSVDGDVGASDAQDYDALLLPGGTS
jgi:protease I